MNSDAPPVPQSVEWDADDDAHCDHNSGTYYTDDDQYDEDDDYCVHCECCCTCLSCEYGHIDAVPNFGGGRG